MIKPRIIWIIMGGLFLAVALIVIVQLLDVMSRIRGEDVVESEIKTSETVSPLGIAPTIFSDIVEFIDGPTKKLRLSGTAEPETVVIISDRGERTRQIRSDVEGNWSVVVDAIDARPMVLEAVLFSETGVTIRGDETVYRVVLPVKTPPIEDDTVPGEAVLITKPTLIMVSAPGGPTRVVKSPFGGSPANGPLTMGPIDYDDAGGVIFSGTTSEEGRVRLYANNAAIGETRVGAGGRWNFIAGKMLPRGEYEVRAELIRPNADRVQVTVPFELLRATPARQTGAPLVKFEPFRWTVRRELLGGGFQSTVIFAPLEADPVIVEE